MGYRLRVIGLCVMCALAAHAQVWKSHLAYNHVTQIAMSNDIVYGLSDGSIYGVNKLTEKIQIYANLSGRDITCIYYDQTGEQLIIGYSTGKIDVLDKKGTHYISALYEKDMTQRKTINNITIDKRMAYLSTPYGIQTMNLNERKLVDSYWLRPGGQETEVVDVVLTKDSIYAFTTDSLFCASRKANLVDYTYWKREARSSRIEPDANKGKQYEDETDVWYAGAAEGIVRFSKITKQWFTYKPDGPLVNIPYRIHTYRGKVGVLQGGYFISSYKRQGIVMILENGKWHNYPNDYFTSRTGLASITDFSDIAFDPSDPSHFYVTSFGYGMFEFRKDTLYRHYTPSNSALQPVLPDIEFPYVWVDGLHMDADGHLWMLNNCENGIKVLKNDGTWVSISNEACKRMDRSKDLLFSVHNPNIKFISSVFNGIGVFDDNGTLDDPSDDRAILCNEFVDGHGNTLTIARISSFFQTADGVLLVGTESGLYRIDHPERMLDGYKTCIQMMVAAPEEGLSDVFETENIRSIMQDNQSHVWIGTQYSGLYSLSEDMTQVTAHFTADNSPLPSNDILSLCANDVNDHIFVGTAEGLLELDPDSIDTGLRGSSGEDEGLQMGSIMQWKLHLCYADPVELTSSRNRIYAAAQGALFSIDRSDLTLDYWNRSTGLNGNAVKHIVFDNNSQQLVIAYEDGRIDLMSENGTIVQMPDLYMKSSSVSVAINCLTAGSNYVYAGTDFGIIAINPRKAEVTDTYYIGEEAASVDIEQIVEIGDTLYAFSQDSMRMYKASLRDNLVDYSFWKREKTQEKVQQAMVWKNELYILQDNRISRYTHPGWQTVRPETFAWMQSNDGKMVVYGSDNVLYNLADDGQLKGLTNIYQLNSAIYTNGEYWLAETNNGLIRLGSAGDDYFHTEGPNSNFGYCMYTAHGQIYSAIGGRWAGAFGRPGRINIYDGSSWRGMNEYNIMASVGALATDLVSLAVDPYDKGHFFAASYGRGVFEFKDYTAVKHYTKANSPLREIDTTTDPDMYTCTDGAMMDEQGNFWVLNTTYIGKPVHVLTPQGQWYSLNLYSGGKNLVLTTPTGIWTDQRSSRLKWLMSQRGEPKLILLDDGGTPTKTGDDRCIARNSFEDQSGKTVIPDGFRCFAQDHNDRIWIGTNSGILNIMPETDFFTSNAVQRIIIPRNDGTGLGDYLLGNEQINCIAVDGGNRVWIGTASSGLYVIEDDTITVAHFTENNSLIPSNNILSIAIIPENGNVFVGTDKGIASYLSDSSEPNENMKNAYAFPNPVPPDYGGMISITGLMDNSEVNIVDAGGNLVCKTRSHGGTAVWDGKRADGGRATAGVYTALCNTKGGHAAVKILIVR